MMKLIALLFVTFLGGMLYASSFPFSNGQFFLLGSTLGFLLLGLALNHSLKKREFLLSAASFNLGFGVLGFYWIAHTLKEFGGLSFPQNHLLAFFFNFLLAPQVYFFALAWYFAKKKSFSLGHHLAPLVFAFLYTLLENFTPQQFPAHLGHTLLELGKFGGLKLSVFFGAGLYSFLIAWIALELARLFSYRRFNLSLVLVLIIFSLDFSYSTGLNKGQHQDLNIRFVQPNIGNFLKINSESGGKDSIREVYDTYYSLSTVESQKKLDLIVWPETAWPTLQNSEIMEKEKTLQPFMKNLLTKTETDLFFGGYDQVPNTFGYFENEYNAAFYLKKNLTFAGVYHKMQLIPFGETLPFGPLNAKLSELIRNVSFFAKGKNYTLFEMDNGHNFISAICYEILFSDFIRDYLNAQKKDVHFLINLTNDSWYGETSEPWQHLFLARWRAVEFNLPIIRSTNTGISTIIQANGEFKQYLSTGNSGILDTTLIVTERKPTLFQIYGILPLIGLVIICFLLHFILNKMSEIVFVTKPVKKLIPDNDDF